MSKINDPVTARERDAEDKIAFLFFGGLILLAVGAVVLGIALANGDADLSECTGYVGDTDECESGSGRTVAIVIGALLAGVGQMGILAGIIGYGVFIGIARAGGRPITAEPVSKAAEAGRSEPLRASPAPDDQD